MDKKLLIQLIESFYLNGLATQVKFKVKNNEAHIKFATDNKDCIGEIKAPVQLEDCEIGIFNTAQLLKLLNITNEYIELKLEKQNNHFLKLHISDNQFDLSYNLSDLGLIQDPGVVPNLPPYDLEFSATNFREIVSVAKSANGKAYLFKDGLLKINLEEEGVISEYFLVALHD